MERTTCRACGVPGTLAPDGYCPQHTRVDRPEPRPADPDTKETED